MPNLISQMRNGTQPQQQSIQPQLNNSIQQVRGMMSMIKNSRNPQQAMLQIIQNNPQLAQITQNGNNFQAIAEQMAQANGINLNELIRQLQGG